MADFEIAIQTILKHEGGYANDPKDRGGETNFGISKRSFPEVDIKHLTRAQAIGIYRSSYWENYPVLRELDSQAVATKLFDMIINMVASSAIRIFQQSINDASAACVVGVDGRLGPMTVRSANALDPERLLASMRTNAARHYCQIVAHDPTQQQFLRGWLLRAYDRPYSGSTPSCPAD
jgi:lysozyme family protein